MNRTGLKSTSLFSGDALRRQRFLQAQAERVNESRKSLMAALRFSADDDALVEDEGGGDRSGAGSESAPRVDAEEKMADVAPDTGSNKKKKYHARGRAERGKGKAKAGSAMSIRPQLVLMSPEVVDASTVSVDAVVAGDVPEDWLALALPPRGKRLLLVASKGITTALPAEEEAGPAAGAKRWHSLLPCGGPSESGPKWTLLDCFCEDLAAVGTPIVVLDTIMWAGTDLSNATFELRAFLAASRLGEEGANMMDAARNPHPVVPAAWVPLHQMTGAQPQGYSLLLKHKEGLYLSAQCSPLSVHMKQQPLPIASANASIPSPVSLPAPPGEAMSTM